jgi:hypothetical protein
MRVRRHSLIVGVLIVAALVVVLVVVNRANDGTQSDQQRLADRLTALGTAVGPDPAAPPGAMLISRQEFTGDLISDGPAIEWAYTFTGTSQDWTDFYRASLTRTGGIEEPVGNLPDQLVNFRKIVPGQGSVSLRLFGPGGDDPRRFALTASR